MKILLLFKHGINENFSPEEFKKSSLDSLLISSKVSKQSETNPGQYICIFFLYSVGRLTSLSEKYGYVHSAIPNLDWKTISYELWFSFSDCAISFAVARHCMWYGSSGPMYDLGMPWNENNNLSGTPWVSWNFLIISTDALMYNSSSWKCSIILIPAN